MAAIERCFVSAKDAHPISTINSRQGKTAKLQQIPPTMAPEAWEDIAVSAIVIEKCETWRLVDHDSDVERGQVAMNKTPAMQTADLFPERSQHRPLCFD